MRRVVVTGMGALTPMACGVRESWDSVLQGNSGASKITKFNAETYPVKIACEIPFGDGKNNTFNPSEWVEAKEQRHVDDFIIYAEAAAIQAVQDSGWKPTRDEDSYKAGVIIGSGIGGLQGIEKTSVELQKNGLRKVSPFFIPGRLINLASGYVSIRHKFKGPNVSVVTACATGAHAIADAARLISTNEAEVMLAGGTEAAITPVGVAGFAAARALSTKFNDTPEKASRPFDKDRDGFVMGEGAGVLFLESLDSALNRDARIYAEVKGYGYSADASHITLPSQDGNGAFRAMQKALINGKLNTGDIDYINAHGTSTPQGDDIELGAVERLFKSSTYRMAMSSTKSSTGHLLGAAGAIEAIFSILSICDGLVPPTINLDNPSSNTKIDLIPHKSKEKKVKNALSNSFGFGGTNVSIAFSRFLK